MNWYFDPLTAFDLPTEVPQRFHENLTALELLAELEKDNRLAKDEGEQARLAGYTGWTGIDRMLGWEGAILPYLRPNEGFTSADTTQVSTPLACRTLWEVVQHLGFNGGKVLEPGLGSGRIQGACPAELRKRVAFTGIESDPLSARIASQLFPEGNVIHAQLQRVLISEPCDLVIGHVPTSDQAPVDDKLIGCELDLHNYCIARGLHALKPGGLLVVLTGHQTLDHRVSQRRTLANLCEFVGAIRLPQSLVCLDKQSNEHNGSEAFDIIVLRRPDGRRVLERGNWVIARERNGNALTNRWGNPASGKERRRNEYYDSHPEMIIGEQHPGDSLIYPPQRIDSSLSSAIAQLPADIASSKVRRVWAQVQAKNSIPVGAYFIDQSGRVRYQDSGRSVVPSLAKPDAAEKFRLSLKSRIAIAKSYIGLRDHYLALVEAQSDASLPESDVDRRRRELNDLYDAQVERWGRLSEPGASWSLMADDLYYFTVLGLEEVKATARRDGFEITKAPVLSRRTVESRSETSGAQTLEEALVLSIGWKGMIDVAYMSSLIGRSEAEVSSELVSRELVYLNPLTNRLETREDYLSGNVREKYERVRTLVSEGDERFKANRSALEAVLTKDIPIEEIDCKLGAKWINPNCIAGFMRDFFKVEAEVVYGRADQWKVDVKSGRASVENTTVYGSSDMRAHEIIQRLLNQRSMAVYKDMQLTGSDGITRIFDPVATAALEEKGVEIQQLFTQYARSNSAIAQEIVRDFNARLNSHVPKTYSDGRHLRLPGFSNAFRRDEHQLQAVWRGLLEGCGLKVYETGSGKTLIQVMLAREARRLNQATRPMIVAHNPTLGQFAETFRLAYPDAKLLIAGPGNFNPDNREKFLERASKCDWDAIIISHADFTKISCSRNAIERYYDQVIEDLEECLEDARSETSSGYWDISRNLKGARKQKQNALEAYKHKSRISWEDLKVDLLLVDEVQEFKRVPFTTKMEQIKGVDISFSHRALDLAIKALDVQERNGNGRGVFGLSATPLDNTVAEIWNLARLTAPKKLQEFGVETFDQFAASFCQKISNLELNEANDTFRRVTRLAKFKNGQSFASFIGSFVDAYMPNAFRRAQDLSKPELATGRPIPVILALSESNRRVKEMMKRIWTAYEASRELRHSYIPWLLIQLGQAAALDPRLVVPHFPEDRVCKIRQIARNVARIYQESDGNRGVQLILMDRYRPIKVAKLEELVAGRFRDISSLGIEADDPLEEPDPSRRRLNIPADEPGDTFNAHRAQRRACIEEGVRPEEIIVLEDAIKDLRSPEARTLWEKLNAGQLRVVIATRDKVATGINIQRRLIALHEADPPRSLRPGKMKQGHGRIDRQGNLNKEIYIYQYGMEQTADAGTYNRIETKAKLFNQLLCGYAPGTNFDDPCSETVQSLAEIKALITGDQRVIDLVRLQDEVRNLDLQRRAFFRQLGENRRRLTEMQTELDTQRGIIIPRRERLFEVTSQEVGIKSLFGKIRALEEPIDVAWADKKITVSGKQLSELLDFILARVVTPLRPVALQIDQVRVRIEHNGLLERNRYDYSFLDPDRPGSSLYTAQIHGTGADMLRSLEALPARSGEFLDQAKRELAQLERNITKLSGAIQTDWPDEVVLAAKRDQVLALERAIEKGEEMATGDWLSELERIAAEEAEQQRSWEEESDEVQLPDHPGAVRVRI